MKKPSAMRLLMLLCCCCWVLPVQAGGDPWQACLDAAKRRQPAEVELPQDCPELFRALRKQDLPASAEPPISDRVSLAQLEYMLRSRQTGHAFSGLDHEGLDALLAGILQPEAPNPETAWRQTLMAWLEQLQASDYETQYRWLVEFLRAVTPSAAVVRWSLYAAIALLVILSLWLIARECYYAGVFVKFPGLRRNPPQHRMRMETTQRPGNACQAVDASSPPARQIASLLEQVSAGLADANLLPRNAACTYRELGGYLGEREPHAAKSFMRLLQHAEPVLYGARAANAETLRVCRREAQLLAELSGV
ncbi:MAG: DUF4129 domain-containing protein [Gammaproteobacteria bacterium]